MSAPSDLVESIFRMTRREAAARLKSLTLRERQVARLIASGKMRHDIAKSLGMGVKTIDVHVARMYWKLKARSWVGVAHVVWASKLGAWLAREGKRRLSD